MAYNLYQAGELIGAVVRCEGGVAYAYLPNRAALGTFADFDSAALAARVAPEPVAA
jgi:ribosomal protein L7Ae-like RNA K-turn-binding protein